MKKILYTILIILIILFCILLYSRFIGPKMFTTNEISYQTEYINSSYNGLKIVHFSDLHYKKIITQKRVRQIINEIRKLKPDIVLFTGDLLDRNSTITNKDTKFLIDELSKIESTYGNFAIIGDNDYLKANTIKSIYIQSNFTLLDNNYTIIHNESNDKIFIGGLSTATYEEADIDKVMNYFTKEQDIPFKIVLLHEGDYITTILNKYNNINLILGGHSINGSINIPLIKQLLTPKLAKKYYKPHYQIENTDIYISNGIGLNTLNFRLFNHPSINFYRITKKN